MFICACPLSVIAAEISRALDDSLPAAIVESKYSYSHSDDLPEQYFRALPDDEGVFYLDITLDKTPEVDEEISVYYRTVDDTAVAKWGDYESVGALEEAYVTLNKANGYKARVIVRSTILDYASLGNDGVGEITPDNLVSRRFLFELVRVEGNAVLHEPESDSGTIKDRNKSRLYCYLKANSYIKQENDGQVLWEERPVLSLVDNAINTDYIYFKGSVTRELNYQFPDYIKKLVSTGNYKLGLSIVGFCKEDYWNSDGPVTFDLYYTYQGKKQKAFTFIIEGEFDDSQFFGFEHAFDYVIEDYYDEYYADEYGLPYDIDDYINDNFYGFILYDNDGNVTYKVTKDDSRDVSKIAAALKQSLIDGYAFSVDDSSYNIQTTAALVRRMGLHWLTLPSNFVYADSYYWSFTTEADKNRQGRKLEDVTLNFCLVENQMLKIDTDENGNQMVSTNIDQLKEGDPLRMSIRFNQLASIDTSRGKPTITAKVNGKYDVTLELKPMAYDSYRYAFDTFVFEGELPDEIQGITITSLTDITLNYYGPAIGKRAVEFKSFLSLQVLMGKNINDIYGYNRDTRTPVATLSQKSMDNWGKSRSLDIYVNSLENSNSRFNDYVTVYYQWSNSPELPTTYGSKVVFHTKADGEVLKSIVGTGNGEMYLHVKSVSGYGKSSISDMLTGTYDPSDQMATYTPFGPFKFDNSPPELSSDYIEMGGSLKERTISLLLPDDQGGVGLRDMSLYYIPKNSEDGEGILLKKFTADSFTGDPKTLTYTISHADVGVGVDGNGNLVLDRREVEFYWILFDRLGNTSGKTAKFTLVFDTNDYLESEITTAGPYDMSSENSYAQFKRTTETVDELTFIYNYRSNKNKTVNVHTESQKNVYYGFSFTVDHAAFGDADNGIYGAKIYYKGQEITDFTVEETNGVYAIWFHEEIGRGRYDIQLTRREGDSVRVSRVYSVYATDGAEDVTEVKNKIESGTLLNNSVYQLSSEYPYFYYKDSEGNRIQEYYNGVKQPATFSSYSKAKEFVYYMELRDIYLVQLTAATANALNSGTTGYLIAKGETVTPQAGQYWIRYKSDAWTPTSGDSAWVYYYYGTSDELTESALSMNLQSALNAVANRIVGYGKYVILTDTSLFLDSAMGDNMLDKNGMPYLLPEQIHDVDEMTEYTMCHNKWSIQVCYAGDKNIYKSVAYVGDENSDDYEEYPIIGNFALPEDSIFQYMTYGDYSNPDSRWKPLAINKGESFINVFTASGVYYIRELSRDGVAVYAVYVDKEAPQVSFSNTDDNGEFKDIPIDGVEILEIRTKDLYIGSIAKTEYDRLSYVAVYKISNLSLVGIYTADELEYTPVKLENGNYYIVVADHSGNHYTVTAKVNSSDLECQIKESADKFIKLTCNRRSDQILRYEVYLNGELITSTYAAEQTFDKAGLYTIYIQDIYGKVFYEEHIFNRNYPTVTWKYLDANGRYTTYDPENTNTNGFIMTWVSDNQYKISTAVKTRFTFSEGYEFEFVGSAPQHTTNIGAETMVTIEAGQSFTLKVYYKNHKDCYTIYSGVVDITPPSINVSAETDVLRNGEYDLFDQWIANGVVSMNELYYQLSEVTRRTVSNGSVISSDIVKINASDINGLSFLEVYLDGTLIKRQDTTTGFEQIIVSRWGDYSIIARDTLGNVSEFTFTNGMPDGFSYSLDGVEGELELHGHLNFQLIDGKYVYSKVNYANTELMLNIWQTANVFISVGTSGETAEIYGFGISDGKIYPLTYEIVLDKNGNETVQLSVGEAIIDMSAENFKANREILISRTGEHEVYASISADGTVSITVYASDDASEILSVNARVEFVGGTTMFVSAEISGKKSDVSFEELGVQTNSDIRVNGGFTVDESAFADERIASVRLYCSALNDLDVNNLEGKTNIYTAGTQYNAEGFYLLIVKNHYGNEKVYRIAISRDFGITSSVTFGDGHKIYYSKDHDGMLYSNNEITLDILDEDVRIEATQNGSAYNRFLQKREDGITYLVFSEPGAYAVKLTDAYGNVVTRYLEINKSTYTVTEELLTGYNEKALKRAEGYTNQMLSIDKAVYDRDGIYYLAIQYGENLTVLFDSFAEVPVSTDAADLESVIGAQGDGVYKIICRNRYGAVVTKDIHYRGTPTLTLERTTRSQSDSEIYDLNYAVSLGFWSNNTLTFSTEAELYTFKINGIATECPRTLVFENAGDYGNFEYDITYIDEYGFEYSFKAYLVRKNITIDLAPSVSAVEIDGVLNTKNNISITFAENVYATYTRNNGEEVIYRSGEVLKKDGTYRFTIIDYAGNATTMVIRKDTMVEFSFIETNTGVEIQNGFVVNSSKIGFHALNKDSAYIEKVLLNGVLQTDFAGTKFSEDGKWELILSDKLGNKAYFCFYIITKSQNGFAYTSPYEYRITEMWYDSGDGVKISYMNFVDHTDFTSSFDFKENGKYIVVMTSDVTGITSTFEFTVNTNAPEVFLVGCNEGETTLNDISLSGCKVGDRIRVYKATDTGEKLVEEIEVTSLATKMPTITEGGTYRIVVESEAGVSTELTFVRKHVMNTAGSIFIMVMIGLAVVGLFTGLIYRNKSKTDE